jgi:hypothetical protein
MGPCEPPHAAGCDAEAPKKGQPYEMTNDAHDKTADSWEDELKRLDPALRTTRLPLGWANGSNAWELLHEELDRLRRIKTDVVWLATDAATAIDKKLIAVGDVIDRRDEEQKDNAATCLSEAENMIQRAWLSRWYNQWHIRLRPKRFWFVPAAWPCIAVLLGAALVATGAVIYLAELHPRGEQMSLTDAFYASTLWGLAGGLVLALKTIHERVQRQVFEIQRVAWYLLSPVLGFGFGAIAMLLFLAGLLATGLADTDSLSGEEGLMIDPTPILLLALLAGFAQNTFIEQLGHVSDRVFNRPETESGAPEEAAGG